MEYVLNEKCFFKDLEYIVNIDSGSRYPKGVAKVADFFEKEYKAGDLNCWITHIKRHDFDSSIGPCLEIAFGKPPYDSLLICHMDTVWPEGTMAKHPYRIDGNRIYGPGVGDMKTSIMMVLYAMRELKKNNAVGSFCIMLNSEEEISSLHTRKWIENLATQSRTTLVMEPARRNGNRVIQRNGLAQINLKFLGRTAHAGMEPERGASAVTEMCHWILELQNMTDYSTHIMLMAGLANGGVARNVIPHTADATIDFRFASKEQENVVYSKLKYLQNNPFVNDVKTEFSFIEGHPPFQITPKAQSLAKIVDEVAIKCGTQAEWEKSSGISDGNFSAALGIPTVDGMGPIAGDNCSLAEYVEIESINPRFNTLCKVLERLGKRTDNI